MITSYDLGFCNAYINEDYILVEMNEGITVVPEYNIVLLKLVDKHFNNKPFVYITHRIHSYSVDPRIYLETAKIENLLGFAVVSSDPIQKSLTDVEKTFFKKEFRKFDCMESALLWKDALIKEHRKKLV